MRRTMCNPKKHNYSTLHVDSFIVTEMIGCDRQTTEGRITSHHNGMES